jgi:hypothetical protein
MKDGHGNMNDVFDYQFLKSRLVDNYYLYRTKLVVPDKIPSVVHDVPNMVMET